jgi:hypothetical protein
MSKFTELFKSPVAFNDVDGLGTLGYGVSADYDIAQAREIFKEFMPIEKHVVEKQYVRMSIFHTANGSRNMWTLCENKKGAKAIWYLDLE